MSKKKLVVGGILVTVWIANNAIAQHMVKKLEKENQALKLEKQGFELVNRIYAQNIDPVRLDQIATDLMFMAITHDKVT